MNALPKIGRYLFAIPFAVFGVNHFLSTQTVASMVPIPGGVFWAYVTGIALIAASVAIMTGSMAVWASRLLALFLLLTATTVHLPLLLGGDQAAVTGLLKDLALAGGALLLSGAVAQGERMEDAAARSEVEERPHATAGV